MNQHPQNIEPTIVENNILKNQTEKPDKTEQSPLGSGVIIDKIGQGGMAEVFKIWNKDLDTFRAVKIAKPELDEQSRRRFITEARIVEKLRHHNIIEIKNIGQWNNLPYVEMEYVDGSTLRSIIDNKGALNFTLACGITINILNALKYAHSATVYLEGKSYKGIFHRDLKPENIMVTNTGRVLVMDFGLARPIAQGINSTCINTFVGSPRYAAPEQFQLGKIDHRADLYAVGIILYEMLSGKHPFLEIEQRCNNAEEYITERRCVTALMVDTTSLKLPSRLSKVIRRCLEIDPNKRYQSAGEMLDELKTIHSDAETTEEEYIAKNLFETEENAVQQSQPIGRRNEKPKLLPVIIAVAAGLVLGGTIAAILLTGPRESLNEPPTTPSELSEKEQQTIPLPIPPQKTEKEESAPEAVRADSLFSLNDEKTKESSKPTVVADRKPLPQSRETGAATQPTTDNIRNTVESPKKPTPPVAVESINESTLPHREVTEKTIKKDTTAISLPQDPVDLLKKQYGKDDLIAVAIAAMQKSKIDDALQVLAAIPENHPDAKKKTVLLLECYIQSDKFRDAKRIIDGTPVSAMEFEYFAGRIHFAFGYYDKAIDCFNKALEKKCLLAERRGTFINESLYYTALSCQKRYTDTKTDDNLVAAREAWLTVKNRFADKTGDPRFNEAVQALSKL